MKLDASILRYLEKDEFRVLTAIEMGMKNHEIVPLHLIESIAKLKRGGAFKVVQGLLKKKLITHMNKNLDGYCLTYQGYDILAINVFIKRGLIKQLGSMMGTGKESDIYLCIGENNQEIVLKLARLGRISFRAVKAKRDYLKGRSKHNWLYLSRLSAIKEFTFMQSLHAEGLPTPTPISHNRHAILMSLLQAYPLIDVVKIENPDIVLNSCFNMAVKFAQLGLVHCDFNQFNLLVSEEEELFVIDFPQMVSVNHFNAEELFCKDLECLNLYFGGRYGVTSDEIPKLSEIEVVKNLDSEIKASGYLRENLKAKEIREMDQILRAAKGDDEIQIEEDEGEESADEENCENEKEDEENCEKRNEEEKEEVDEDDAEEEKNEESQESDEESQESGNEDDIGENNEESDHEGEENVRATKEKKKRKETKKDISESEIKEKLKKIRKKRNGTKVNQNKVKAKSQLNY